VDQQINVAAVESLEDLAAGLAAYRAEATAVLEAVHAEIQRTFQWLADRATYWRGEIHRREVVQQRAMSALRQCQNSGYTDRDGHYHAPDCSAYQTAVLHAQVAVADGKANLQSVQKWTELVQGGVASYQREADRLRTQLGDGLPRAIASLQRNVADLQSYLAITTSSGGGPTSTWIPFFTSPTPDDNPANRQVAPVPGGGVEMRGGTELERGPESREGGSGGPERGG
jgi:hypothetical protein